MKPAAVACTIAVLCLSACMHLPWNRKAGREVIFVSEVKPLLETRCLECHSRHHAFASLNLETEKLAMKGGRSGAVIISGAPEQSLLYKVLFLGHDSPVAMPPTPERLEREDQEILYHWILQGAQWPDGIRLVPPQDWATPRS